MKIVTVGLGYIGLPSAVMFASKGLEVIGVDNNLKVISILNSGNIHINEPGIEEIFKKVIKKGNFVAQGTVPEGDVFIIAVPTPNRQDKYKSCDLSHVISAISDIIPKLKKDNTIIVESTIPPKTLENIILPMIEESGFIVGKDIYLCHCPERVLPGRILHELQYNNRIIGGITKNCSEKGANIYKTFVKGEMILTEASVAELSKIMENTFRDVNIALSNELVKVSNKLNINALEVIEVANKHPRVNIHSPGPGVGGHCLAVDPYFIISKTPELTPLIQNSREINSSMPEYIFKNVDLIMKKYNGKKITILGITYKGNIDDIRESPALKIIDKLKKNTNYQITLFDPYISDETIEPNFDFAITDSDLIIILADHDDFKNITEKDLSKMKQKIIFDTKNIVDLTLKDGEVYNLGNLYSIETNEDV